jgi:hypothetical protein
MIIHYYNISLTRGDTASLIVKMRDPDGNQIPFQLGDVVYFTVKKSTDTIEKVLQKVITEFVDGNAEIYLLHDDTKGLATGDYVYDIQVNRGVDQSVTTIIPPSRFSLSKEVTYE